MSINEVTAGKNVPQEFNVIIEIPMNADPIKYEVDKNSGALFVDRFRMMATQDYSRCPPTRAASRSATGARSATCRISDSSRSSIFFEHYEDLEANKWVEVIGGNIARFSTFMTGELFEVLTRHTILAQSAEVWDFGPEHPSFVGAAARGLVEPDRALARIFETRAAQLLGFESAGDGSPHLSGLLIGSEIGAALRIHQAMSVTLVASGAIAALYRSVLERAGVSVRLVDAEAAVRRGLFAAAAAIWSQS